ncbi:MAG: type II toxin-antitoxin system RelE/ParE family toxin [Lentimicrobium sp.]|jgi:plasmid stabilization system protein ParE|nr:type II toxin-antitoxin system RelE/ParE family toxin [Lentimicrobium sp.]
MLEVKWSSLAEITLAEEIDFILRKWNLVEADKFVLLVYSFLEGLAKKPEIGIFNSKLNCFSIVISKQTTLYYRILESEKKVELVLFWNNKQNPTHLKKLLR